MATGHVTVENADMPVITLTAFRCLPLESQTATAPGVAGLSAFDGMGRKYASATGDELTFPVSGALGWQVVAAYDTAGVEIARESFSVDCQSEIVDEEGDFPRLLMYCKEAMFSDFHRPENVKRVDGDLRRGFVLTSRDHVHGVKAMKYFHSCLPEWLDGFAAHQPESGMIWDFCKRRNKPNIEHFENRWGEQFHLVVDNGHTIFARQPVMNDVEYMFLHGVYFIWKTTGDDDWMAGKLDNCLRAIRYATTSPYTWSEKFQLIKRPFCIDMWDFQSQFDADLVGGDAMQAIPGVSQYGVMFGDNLGFASGCEYVAEMLRRAGRKEEAPAIDDIAKDIRKRLDAIAWNGDHFTHFVPEDPTFQRDFGVDTDRQVTLSNAYALNRGITHEQAVAIIRTYQRLREETGDTAPAEWFCCYPPFPRGFGSNGGHRMWQYVNGGVSPMVAGELARGSFEHGFESYGYNIIRRVLELGDRHEQIPRVWCGKNPGPPQGPFHPVDLHAVANADFSGETKFESALPFVGEGDNDLRTVPAGRSLFAGIPFEVIAPSDNEGRACLILSEQAPYMPSAELPVREKAGTLFFLHAGGKAQLIGELVIHYTDGETRKQRIWRGEQVSGWWMPKAAEYRATKSPPLMKVGWTGANPHCKQVGLSVYAHRNPRPDAAIDRIELRASDEGGLWIVAGVTLGEQVEALQEEPISGGIPAPWSVGAVVYACYEGLAGVQDHSAAYRSVRLTPRWAAGDKRRVTVAARYEDNGAYVRYTWQREPNAIQLEIASCHPDRQIEILLPEGCEPTNCSVNGTPVEYEIRIIEASRYLCFVSDTLEALTITVTF